MLPPKQIVAVPLALTVGNGVTVIVTTSVAEHPEEVPVTVYVLVIVEEQIGLAIVELLSPVAGDQL